MYHNTYVTSQYIAALSNSKDNEVLVVAKLQHPSNTGLNGSILHATVRRLAS